ncbi:MAG: hypothetical protein Q7K57_57535 [Burkholderiaceae bacterium]|nr:hypothetical protein [Polaromonas sp.]MDO8778172.1 hypothetical protein [Burkholderiaceae bacterium]
MIKRRGELTDRQKADRDDKRAKTALHQTMLVSTVKGFAVLNGAGVLAVLGFIQALVGKGHFEAFKPFAVWSLCLYMVGALAATMLYLPLSAFLNLKFEEAESRVTAMRYLAVTMACVMLGSAVCAWGIAKTL